ncbi:MAG: DNA translocase FtsK 4TM domain-containing protein, partial [Wenzhouxiangellaceae bacterium]
MPRAKKKKTELNEIPARVRRGLIESLFLLMVLLASYLLLCLTTHDSRDPGFSRSGGEVVGNLGGRFGAWISDLMLVVLGYVAWLLPLLLIAAALRLLRERAEPVGWPEWGVRIGGLALILLSGCILFEMQPRGALDHTGGIIGDLLSGPMVQIMGFTGAALINLVVLAVGITLFTGLSWIVAVERIGGWAIDGWRLAGEKIAQLRDWLAGRRARAEREELRKRETVKRKKRPEVKIEPRIEAPPAEKAKRKLRQPS